MAKGRVKRATGRSVVVLFATDDDRNAGERLLERSAGAAVLHLGPAVSEEIDPAGVVRVRDLGELRAWLRQCGRQLMPATFRLGLEAEFDVHGQAMAALASMRVPLPHVLSSGQDQIFVLDREQRMVAFFGHWPKEAPFRVQDLMGKRKRDVFGPDVAAVHEAAGLRALNGEVAAYEWSVTHARPPVHLFTTASPLRNGDREVAGILLVTRDITRLKQAQIEIEKALLEKTNQLREVERAMRQVAAAFQPSARGELEHAETSGLHSRAFLSKREQEVLSFLRRGVRLRSIAQTLGLSVETVRRHVKAMFRKTGVHSQEALAKLFSDTGDQP